ncbi:hypothetical protein WDZ92_36690 [Nostoc sp. NIES-2111]
MTATMNRAQRRQAEKAGRRPVKRANPAQTRVIPVNPLFALDIHARNRLATSERQAFDALLEHRATPDHVGEIETLIETAIRAIGITQRENLPHLDGSGLAEALKVFHRAAWSIRRAKVRQAQAGVYGLDAADRAALMQADELVAEMRKPGVILRKTWLTAFRESYMGRGVVIPAFEELEPA